MAKPSRKKSTAAAGRGKTARASVLGKGRFRLSEGGELLQHPDDVLGDDNNDADDETSGDEDIPPGRKVTQPTQSTQQLSQVPERLGLADIASQALREYRGGTPGARSQSQAGIIDGEGPFAGIE